MVDGAQRQWFQGESLLLTRGSIQLMPPGEVHDGAAASDEAKGLTKNFAAIVKALIADSKYPTPPLR